MQEDWEIAKHLKRDVNEVRRAKKYIEQHPHDLMRSDDRNFERVWGKKMRDNEDKLKWGKEDAVTEHREMENYSRVPVEKRKTYH